MYATNITAAQQAAYDALTWQCGLSAAVSFCMAAAFIVSTCFLSMSSAFRSRRIAQACMVWGSILSTGDFIYALSVDRRATPEKLAIVSGVNYFMLVWSTLLSALVLVGTYNALSRSKEVTGMPDSCISGVCFVASLCPTVIFGVWTSLPSA